MMGLAATANVRGLQEYVDALEEEKRKMEVFQRELPLCLDVVAQAIEGYKRQMMVEEEEEEEEEVEEEEVGCCGVRSRVLEELMPLRPVVSCDGAEEKRGSGGESEKKTEWLKSVKLWTQDAVLSKDDGKVGAEKGKEVGQNRKARRCWSPELHRMFVHALQHLGGSHATPKQIRELMKVDGLTNDEVKSHLQKYRLHVRRLASQAAAQANGQASTPQATPQVVLGVWMPTNRHATGSMAGLPSADMAFAQAGGIYTSIASLPLESNCRQLLHIAEQKQSSSSPRVHLRTSENTANSCSTATTTSS